MHQNYVGWGSPPAIGPTGGDDSAPPSPLTAFNLREPLRGRTGIEGLERISGGEGRTRGGADGKGEDE